MTQRDEILELMEKKCSDVPLTVIYSSGIVCVFDTG